MLEKLFLEMISYYSGDPKRIQHFTKVHSYAKLIGEREQLSPEELYILEAAAYTHDIGIKPAEQCGKAAGAGMPCGGTRDADAAGLCGECD